MKEGASRVVLLAEASPKDPRAVGGVSGFLRAIERASPPGWFILAPSADRSDREGTLGPSLYLRKFPHRISFPFRLLRRYGRLSRLRPDVVYTHSNEAAMLLCLLRGLGVFRAALVHHQHGSENPLTYATFRLGRMLFLPRLYAAALRRMHLSVDRIVVIDAKCLEMNRRWGVPENRLTLLPNAVDTDVYAPSPGMRTAFRRKWRIPESAFLFAFAGRLEEVKRVHLIIEALSRMEGEPWLVVAGDGSLRAPLEQMAASSPSSDHIRFTGPMDSAGMPPLYAAADCLVLPSSAEGVPLVILEAKAAGIPIVATRVGGVGELVDGASGLLLDAAASPLDLAEAMELAMGRAWDSTMIRAQAGLHSSREAVSMLDGIFTELAGRTRGGNRKLPG